MRVAEKKVGGLLAYATKRAFKIAAHSLSKEARMMRAKRKAYNKAIKAAGDPNPNTGNAIDA